MISSGDKPESIKSEAKIWLKPLQYDWVWIAPFPGWISLIIIDPAIHDPPALPTSPVWVSIATIENVGNRFDINKTSKYFLIWFSLFIDF